MTSAVLYHAPAREQPHPLLTFAMWQGIGLLLLTCHIYLAAQLGGILAPSLLFIPVVVLVYGADPLAGFILFLQFFLYQNVVVSTASPLLDGSLFRQVLGTSFELWFLLAAVAFLRIWRFADARQRGFLKMLAGSGAVIAAYALLGMAHSSFGSAAAYFRTATDGIVGVIIGLDLGRRYEYRTIATCFLLSAVLGFVLTALEITSPHQYYDAINAKDYYSLNASTGTGVPQLFHSSQGVIDLLTRTFFNFSDNAVSFRFGGPVMHSVSYAYLLTVLALVAVSLSWWPLAVVVLPFIYLDGGKGAAILLVGTSLLWIVQLLFGRAVLLVAAAAGGLIYVAAVIHIGLSLGDYHVLGLLGGLRGFLANPLGHGLGVGGNLSANVSGPVNWNTFQTYGASYGLESAIGVMAYQMGIGSVAFAVVLWRTTTSLAARSSQAAGLFAIAIFILLLNGAFQEEAFSPYALGLLMLLAGTIVANRIPTKDQT